METIAPETARGETMMLAFGSSGEGVSAEAFLQRHGTALDDVFGPVLADLVGLGLIERRDEGVRLTRRGLMLATTSAPASSSGGGGRVLAGGRIGPVRYRRAVSARGADPARGHLPRSLARRDPITRRVRLDRLRRFLAHLGNPPIRSSTSAGPRARGRRAPRSRRSSAPPATASASTPRLTSRFRPRSCRSAAPRRRRRLRRAGRRGPRHATAWLAAEGDASPPTYGEISTALALAWFRSSGSTWPWSRSAPAAGSTRPTWLCPRSR